MRLLRPALLGLFLLLVAVVSPVISPVVAASVIISQPQAIIANGASLSGAVDLAGSRVFGLIVPSPWTGSTTSITFQGGSPGVSGTCSDATWFELYNDVGTAVTITVAQAGEYVVFGTPAAFYGVRCLKVRSGTVGAPVAQGQLTTVLLVAQQ